MLRLVMPFIVLRQTIFSNQPADLSAKNVTVDGKHNTAHVVQSHEEKRSGLTVSVGGQIVNELNNVQQLG